MLDNHSVICPSCLVALKEKALTKNPHKLTHKPKSQKALHFGALGNNTPRTTLDSG